MKVLYIILLIIFNLFQCPEKVVLNSAEDILQVRPGAQIVVKKVVDLQGKEIVIPKGCEIRFAKGGVLTNGSIVYNDTYVKGKGISFCDVTSKGTLKNKDVLAKWFRSNNKESDDHLINAIKLASESGASFMFEDREYSFRRPVFIYGKCNLIGTGRTVLKSYENGQHIFVLAGNTAVGGKAIIWEGKIKGIKFVAQSGNYNYYLGLLNVKNCEVSDCTFDLSGESVNCSNKIIGSVNNAHYSNPSQGSGISILRNTIIVQNIDDNRNNAECIGIENRKNVLIEDNTIFYNRDDLGVHNSENVVIRNNKIYAYDGRIYVSNSKDIKIMNNQISYVFSTMTGMGIYVGHESG